MHAQPNDSAPYLCLNVHSDHRPARPRAHPWTGASLDLAQVHRTAYEPLAGSSPIPTHHATPDTRTGDKGPLFGACSMPDNDDTSGAQSTHCCTNREGSKAA